MSSSRRATAVPASSQDDCRPEQLRRARKTAIVIELAQSVLMQRYGLTAELAYALLRNMSQQLNVEIDELAVRLATTGEFPHLPKTDRR